MPDEIKIKMRAKELCRAYKANQYTIKERNEKIISILMEEFNISRDYATECFLHNNEL